MTVADAQQQRLLERLCKAGDEPVAFAELRAGRIDFLAAVVSELELNGYAIERVYDHGRLVGVRLHHAGGWSACACAIQNLPTHSTDPPRTGAGGCGRTDSQPPYTPRSPQRGPASLGRVSEMRAKRGPYEATK
jgi:hypothetical protein